MISLSTKILRLLDHLIQHSFLHALTTFIALNLPYFLMMDNNQPLSFEIEVILIY